MIPETNGRVRHHGRSLLYGTASGGAAGPASWASDGARCADGLAHGSRTWADRKRELTAQSSARWAGSITKATHDRWAFARRGQFAQVQGPEAGVRTITYRLSLPVGQKGSKQAPGGYHTRQEWFAKARRLHLLEDRLQRERSDREAGRVRVVRGGKRLARARHDLRAAGLSEAAWRGRWEAERWFLAVDGESGKRFGNETIRVTLDGEVSIKLPAPLVDHSNAPHGRYALTGRVYFAHRGTEWADRVAANRAVAYRIRYDVTRGRWYLTASWQIPPVKTIPLAAALADGVIAVDTNADHLAAWRLDAHGNPIGSPHRFLYDLHGPASYRDAQVRHALTRLLNWARTIIAVDPAYTSKWGAQHWQKPLISKSRKTTRHDAAAVAIGRRALGHPIRLRTAPPHDDRSDRRGHRTTQARPGTPGREGTRPRIPGPRTRSERAGCGAKAGDQNARHRSGRSPEHGSWQQDSLPLSFQER